MSEKYILALIKVTSDEKYAEDLRNGKLYMNKLQYFTTCEKDEMSDKLEGRGLSKYICGIKVNVINNFDLCRPVFCMYGIYGDRNSDVNSVSICSKMKSFGDYAVVITNVAEFFKRLKKSGIEFGPVKYQNINYNDIDSTIPYNPIYRKLENFGYQKEFRIVKPNLFLMENKSEIDSELCSIINDDHYVEYIKGGLNDITSEVIKIDKLLYPNKYNIQLSINWENVKFNDFIKYENPLFDTNRSEK